MDKVIGWDLGGANLKLAVVEEGALARAVQIPCPILPDRSKFDQAVTAALEAVPESAGADLHAVTMTGELSDVFESRREGVAYLIALMERTAAKTPLTLWAGEKGLLAPESAKREDQAVASANWLATAVLAARREETGLLVDIGTTTTDLIPFRDGIPRMRGKTDAARLTEGELIYSGVVRTPVMALAQRAPFQGRMQGVTAEKFATLADIYRLTGELPADADPYPTADGRDKSLEASAARLARMLGRDADDAPMADWLTLSRWFADRHREQIVREAEAVIAREALAPDAPVVGAGCGRFLGEALARMLDRPYRDFGLSIGAAEPLRDAAAVCAPAVSVALLAATDQEGSALSFR
ncbi:Hydantoinase/oxoprolinase [Methyloligella halotolerans]|uniref:Hydantoinase/oxoprolinase n=1 Tax=Methyloligella halotolerans TaxID=1177755 RepID=A0A1E2S2P9_9HYPH|nr:hydantoinase/oxoprolinase family protein [Methyloligella halotolerans]ODA68796.1 Hydantoinase/oxoprolinase [Methyloligella halotolerans]